MNNLTYIVIGLAIIIIIAILFMRKNKPSETRRPFAEPNNRPRNPLPHQPPMADQNTSAQPDTSVTSADHQGHLDTAQYFIDQQRYDDAISELKKGLALHPNHKALSLKLLNIYAINNDYDAFNSLYKTIHRQGEPVTLIEANKIKSLLDAERASSAVKPAAFSAPDSTPDTSTDENSNTLDLNLSTDAPAAEPDQHQEDLALEDNLLELQEISTKPSDNSADPVISFDDLENQLLADDPSDQNNSADPTKLGSSSESDFELSLEQLDDDWSASDTNHTDTTTNELYQPTTPADTKSADVDDEAVTFTLDKDSPSDLSGDSGVLEPQITATQDLPADITTESMSDKLTLDDDTTSRLLKEDTNSSDDSLDASSKLSSGSSSSTTASSATTKASTIKEHGATPNTKAVDAKAAPTITLDNEGLDRNELRFDTQATDPVLGDNVADTLAQLDALSLDEDGDTSPTEALAAVDHPDATNSAITTQPMPKPATPVTKTDNDEDEFAADFGFIEDLDGAQVTLDLATQYLDLGEYESAKRLLNEVIDQGDSDQQSQAQALLSKMV